MQLKMFYNFSEQNEKECYVLYDGSCWWLSMDEPAKKDSVVFSDELASRLAPLLRYACTTYATEKDTWQTAESVFVPGGDYDGIKNQMDIVMMIAPTNSYAESYVSIWQEEKGVKGSTVHFDLDEAWAFLAMMEMAFYLNKMGSSARKTWCPKN